MTTETKNSKDLAKVMQDALLQLRDLVNHNQAKQVDFLAVVKTFLLGVVSTAIDLVDVSLPGSAPLLYADLERAMKAGGLREIANTASNHGTACYSIANIDPEDKVNGMNYIGQQLAITLFKCLYELPKQQQNQEMMLRAIEVLLANLLNQKFTLNAHQILDSLCEHVHMALTDLATRTKH